MRENTVGQLLHDSVFMRLWMVDEPGSEVIVGTALAQRYIGNRDFGRTMKVLCVRRPNTESVDTFIAVIEPYQGRPLVIWHQQCAEAWR